MISHEFGTSSSDRNALNFSSDGFIQEVTAPVAGAMVNVGFSWILRC